MRLRDIRISKGLTQQQLSEATGIDQGAISRIENGKQEVRLSDLKRMAQALDVSVASLIEEDESLAA